jgi:hypothetical protein
MGSVPRKQQAEPEFLVVDDTDGRVLAELWSAEEALKVLEELDPSEPISLVRLDSAGGSLVHEDSSVSVRPLLPSSPASPRDAGS